MVYFLCHCIDIFFVHVFSDIHFHYSRFFSSLLGAVLEGDSECTQAGSVQVLYLNTFHHAFWYRDRV